MKLYTVDTNYVKELYDVDSEVFYLDAGYETKPYVGIIVLSGSYKYFIPLTSSKHKHKTWKNVSKYTYLVYEFVNKKTMGPNSIYVTIKDSDKVKHIISVLDIKKMIPVPDGLFYEIAIDSITEPVRKKVLSKEYAFLKPLYTDIQKKASDAYNEQIETGVIRSMFCNFKKLESVCDTYTSK